MNKKNQSKKTQPRRERNSIPWRYGLLTLACGVILIVGFFFAARQHLASIDFSIKNSRLKKQVEELEASKRSLILAKEIAMSPAEIKKAAQKFGFRETTASSVEPILPNQTPTEKLKSADEKKSQNDGEEKDKSRTQIARK